MVITASEASFDFAKITASIEVYLFSCFGFLQGLVSSTEHAGLKAISLLQLLWYLPSKNIFKARIINNVFANVLVSWLNIYWKNLELGELLS